MDLIRTACLYIIAGSVFTSLMLAECGRGPDAAPKTTHMAGSVLLWPVTLAMTIKEGERACTRPAH